MFANPTGAASSSVSSAACGGWTRPAIVTPPSISIVTPATSRSTTWTCWPTFGTEPSPNANIM